MSNELIKCKDCKFWEQIKQIWNEDVFGVCERIQEEAEPVDKSTPAYVTDCMEGNLHEFHSRYDFGCVLGEHK